MYAALALTLLVRSASLAGGGCPAARDRLGTARVELHRLLEDRALERTPILVAANKVDLTPHASEQVRARPPSLPSSLFSVVAPALECMKGWGT